MDYLYILREALVWMVTIFWLYQVVISLCSLVKLKDKPLKINKEHRFMAIIPAHNEEAVVGNLVEKIKHIIKNYMIYMLLQIIVQTIQQKLQKKLEQLFMKDLMKQRKQKDML